MFDGAAVADAAHAAATAAAKALIPDAPAPVQLRAAEPAQDGGKKEVVFVDAAVSDWQALVAGVVAAKPGAEVELLDGQSGGLAQMAKWADSHSGYESIQVLSPGGEASLRLGSDRITGSSLSDPVTQAEMAQLGHALKAGGEIDLYGSAIGAGSDGQALIGDLAAATGAVVAAADHAVGDAAQGGGWGLDVASGPSSVTPLDIPGYLGLLNAGATVKDPTARAVEVQAADAGRDGGLKEVAFIDTSVADWEVLVADVQASRPGIGIELIDGSQSGLAQMADWAATHQGYDAIHLLSHGAEAQIALGTDRLTDAGVSDPTRSAALTAIGSSMKDGGDLLVYGCDVAKGTDGQQMLSDLAAATGRVVAASTDASGAAILGGNWTLEASSDKIKVSPLKITDNYERFLQTDTIISAIDHLRCFAVNSAGDIFYSREASSM